MGDFLPQRCPMEENELLFELNKFHRTTPMARYGSRPIRLEVNIQKKCSDFHKWEHRARLHHNSKQLHDCEVRITRTATPYYKYSDFILFCKIFLKNKSKKF